MKGFRRKTVKIRTHIKNQIKNITVRIYLNNLLKDHELLLLFRYDVYYSQKKLDKKLKKLKFSIIKKQIIRRPTRILRTRRRRNKEDD